MAFLEYAVGYVLSVRDDRGHFVRDGGYCARILVSHSPVADEAAEVGVDGRGDVEVDSEYAGSGDR